MKYNICPICKKKGLYPISSYFYITQNCRYCQSSWGTHKWASVTKKNISNCPDCGYEGMTINGHTNVYPHYCKLPQEIIKQKIARAQKLYLLRQNNSSQSGQL